MAEPATINEQARTVEVTWTTGARVRRRGAFGEDFDEELSLDDTAVDLGRLNAGAALLNSHNAQDLSSVVGVVEKAWLQGPKSRREGRATVRFSARAEVEPIWADMKSGILRNISVGYEVSRWEKVERKNDVPLMRAAAWTPLELSFVPIPADPGAQARAGFDTPTKRTMVTEISPKPAEISSPLFSTADQPRPDPAAAERERVQGIYKMARFAGADDAEVDEMVTRLVPLDEARTRMINAKAARQDGTDIMNVNPYDGGTGLRGGPAGSVRVSDRSPAAVMDSLGAAFGHKLGARALPDHARPYVDLSLADMAGLAVEARGYRLPHYATAKMKIDAIRKHSTSDFTHILTTGINASLTDAYQAARDELADLTVSRTVEDFLPRTTVRASGFPPLREVKELGEYEHGSLNEAAESFVTKKYGRQFGASWELLLAERFDVLGGISSTAGAAAANLESEVLSAVLLANPTMADGTPVFHSNRLNIQTTGSALGTGTLASAMVLLRRMRNADLTGFLNLRAGNLVVSAELERLARTLVSDELSAATAGDSTAAFRGISVLVSPRLPAATWFLFPATGSVANLIAARLTENANGPHVETREGWDVDEVTVKVRHTFGAAWQDFRAVYSTGAA